VSYIPLVSPMSRAQIEAEALELLRGFYPELLLSPRPFPVLDFFDRLKDDYGLDPAVSGKLGDGVEGVTLPDGRVYVSESTYRMAVMGEGRARFTILHECFHGIKHRAQIRDCLVHTGQLALHRKAHVPSYRDPEWQANVFASAALMPEPTLRQCVAESNGVSLIQRAARVFETSFQAASIRLGRLGLS
jgi:hypothetical protein